MTMITPSLHAGLCSRRARDPIQCLNVYPEVEYPIYVSYPYVRLSRRYTLEMVPTAQPHIRIAHINWVFDFRVHVWQLFVLQPPATLVPTPTR